MNTIKTFIFLIILGFSSFWTLTIAYAQNIKVPFKADKVIEQVHQYQVPLESRTDEFLIDTTIIYIPADGGQGNPAIAFDGTNHLVIWRDERSGTYDIYGTRVSQAGTVLDPAGIPIKKNIVSLSIAFGDTNYLVVWGDSINGDYKICGARMDTGGRVLDTLGIIISAASGVQSDPSVAFDGTNFFVVWSDYRNGSTADIYGARVSQSGFVLDTSGIPISISTNSQYGPRICFGSTDYLVVWNDRRYGIQYRDIFGTRVSINGVVLDTAGIAITTGPLIQRDPVIAFGGTNFFVEWSDTRNGANDIYCTRVTQTGLVLDTAGIPVSIAPNNQIMPSVIFDGVNYFSVWGDNRIDSASIYGARINLAGIVIDTMGIPISSTAYTVTSAVVAFNGSDNFVVYQDRRPFPADIFGARVTTAGSVIDTAGIDLSTAVNPQAFAAVASDRTDYFTVWRNMIGNDLYEICGMRVDSLGNILDSRPIPVSTYVKYYNWNLAVAYDISNYFIVWDSPGTDLCDICGARVSPSGIVLDTTGIVVCTAPGLQDNCSVAFGNTTYLVVWTNNPSGWLYDVYGARVNPSGIVLDTNGIAIANGPNDEGNPSVAFGDTIFFVAWGDSRNDAGDIYGARVTLTGMILDTLGIAVSTATGVQTSTAIAFDGNNFLVVWSDYRNGSNADVYGARVTQTGLVLDTNGIAISTATNDQYNPVVAFDGTNYVIVWQDYRNGSSDLYGAKVNTSGNLVSSYAVCTNPQYQGYPAIVSNGTEHMLLTFSGWADSIRTHPARVQRIWGKFYPFVGIEENAPSKNQMTALNFKIYPSIARKKCNIEYGLQQNTEVSIMMYDATGRLVKKIVEENQNAGSYHKIFDTTELPQGVYFIKLDTPSSVIAKKIILIK